jgi:hypothetical protein
VDKLEEQGEKKKGKKKVGGGNPRVSKEKKESANANNSV